jgi:predicted ABC-type ATPase
MKNNPVLHLVAGPNGAGKSTFVNTVLLPVTRLPFVNADVIAASNWPGNETANAYQAAKLAQEERRRLFANRSSFITETVFSHESKLALVAAAEKIGYLIELHVILIPESIATARVDARVANGGHDVPPEKVIARFQRLFPLVAVAQSLTDRTTFYDNSTKRAPFRVVAQTERGQLIGRPDWPIWTPAVLVENLQ